MNLGEIVSVDLITTAAAVSPIPVPSATTVYTPSFPMVGVGSIELLADSTGSVDVLIELEVGSAPPATEEASDANWAEPDGMADIINLVDEVIHVKEIDPPKMKYGRLKMTGQGSNHASTTVRIKLNRREYP